MALRFLHTADWHIGATSYIPDALERQISTIDWLFKEAIRHKVSAMLVCGDVFHHHSSPDQVFKDRLLELLLYYNKRTDFPVLFIEGNHSRSVNYSSLQTYYLLERNKKIRNMFFATTEPRFLEFDSFNALLVPNGLDYRKILKKYAKKARKKPTVALLHEFFDGAVLDNKTISKSSYKLPCMEEYWYFACGDVHYYGQIGKCSRAWYSGSPIQHTVGEQLPKGYLLVEDPESPVLVETPKEIAKPIIKVKEGEEIPSDAYVIYCGSPSADLPENVVRVIPRTERSKKSFIFNEGIKVFKLSSDYLLALVEEELKELGFPPKTIEKCKELAKPYISIV